MELLFPHNRLRDVQKDMVALVQRCLETKTPAVMHAPTGLGKTAAALAPAISFALQSDLAVFFLTSRHTQHIIALQTLKEIKTKFGINIPAISMVGKKHLCAQGGVATMRSEDFFEYCRAMREDGKCSFYSNARAEHGQPTKKAELVAAQLSEELPAPSEHVLQRGSTEGLCPYELSLILAANSKAVIADYNYIFQPNIREAFLAKIGKKLEQCIVIVDEGHNLPARLREQLTQRLSSFTLRRAVKEAKKYSYSDALDALVGLQDVLNLLSRGVSKNKERLVTKLAFLDAVKRIGNYGELVSLLESAADGIREEQKTSAIGTVAGFLKAWNKGDEGYSRIIAVKEFRSEQTTVLSHRCLDPSLAAKEVIERAYCTLIMSGTLTPTTMFADVLGFPENTVQREFPSPFPAQNKISLIVPGATTKFSQRSEAQYLKISGICARIVNSVPGCSAVFFPSYAVRDAVAQHLSFACKKTVFVEDSRATKEERQKLLQRFAGYKEIGAVLLGVTTGSFGEGVDLPGVLKSVIVVGVPLEKPDLETSELIAYYDSKFHKGWDYGYILPAITKTLQNAGRCIRSETDKGLLVFLDERYAQAPYSRCFPKDWNPVIAHDPLPWVEKFFGKTL